MKDKNPNDNLVWLFLALALFLFGAIAASNLWMKHKLNQSYTTQPTVQTHGSDELVEHKQWFKITFEPLEE